MKFKAKRIETEWNDKKLSPILKTIVEDAAKYAKTNFDWEFVITSIYRSPTEDGGLSGSGIHTAWRAVDVRTRDRKKIEIDKMADYINAKYEYNKNRPTLKVCFKEVHGSGPHAHFQSHPNTKKRN